MLQCCSSGERSMIAQQQQQQQQLKAKYTIRPISLIQSAMESSCLAILALFLKSNFWQKDLEISNGSMNCRIVALSSQIKLLTSKIIWSLAAIRTSSIELDFPSHCTNLLLKAYTIGQPKFFLENWDKLHGRRLAKSWLDTNFQPIRKSFDHVTEAPKVWRAVRISHTRGPLEPPRRG